MVAAWALNATTMVAKRKSGGGDKPPKALKSGGDIHVPVDLMLKENVRLFDQWLPLGILDAVRRMFSHVLYNHYCKYFKDSCLE